MLNLLPKEEKYFVRAEYRRRLAVVSLVALGIATLLGSIFLLPAFFHIRGIGQNAKENAEKLKNDSMFKEREVFVEELSRANDTLKAFSAKVSGLDSHELIRRVVSRRLSGIYLSLIDIRMSADGESGELKISGTAKDRATLRSFAEALRRETIFSSVDVPVGNFAKERNLVFSISVKGKF